MSLILQPQVAFPIVRQIANHLDSTTYYVRAVVRDASGNTIDTVDLASQGSQRYQTSWAVPADPTGRGIYVSIVTSVYTDSGYTTKSADYGDEENTYLIFDRVMPAMRGGNGGVDARTVRRIVEEEIAKIPKPEPVVIPEPKEPEMRWNDVLASIGELHDVVDRIPTDRPDLAPVIARISMAEESIKAAIDAKEVTPPCDHMDMMEKMDSDKEDDRKEMQEIKGIMFESEKRIAKAIPTIIREEIDRTNFVANVSMTPEAPKKPLFDAKKLAS